ncbi:MAG TPA: multiheme c-type cytochrome [Gemmatimonadaceae bacterium]|nr:multiheme c-type cytochrome [Gemmatimonadaceae bacterium]
MPRRFTAGIIAAGLGAVLSTAGCVRDNIVYRDRSPVQAPAAAAKFVGYSDTSSKQTTCGNCHVDQQSKWSQTAHANAWADLKASGHSAASCENCHSVSELGNAATGAVGYAATKDARYTDVQCESCHGPGLDHITAPTISNRPLASISADTGTKLLNGCGECHTGIHEPFVDEWRSSAHGTMSHQSSPKANADSAYCKGCHSGQDALVRFGVNTNYVEKNTSWAPITCAVCHDPHGSTGIDKQLRLSVSTPNIETNLCMKCHQRRAVPDQPNYSRNSPHSPEGELLLGNSAGWYPPLMNVASTDTIIATHGTKANARLCAGCHVTRWTVNDPATGAFAFQVTGHRFEATPCVDASGKPTGKTDCTEAQKAFKGCVASGCHGTEAVARSAFETAETRILSLAAQIDALIAKVPSTEIKRDDGKYTTAEGAQFNAALARTGGAAAHNPFLVEQLLTASIKQLQKDYNLPVASTLNLNNLLPNHSKTP